MDQIIIKVALIAAFALFAFVLIRASSTPRSQALRTFGLGLFFAVVVVAVLFPTIVNDVAILLGVGRGTDLLLYVFIVVFIGQAMTTHRRRRAQDEQITELARKLALMKPNYPPPTDK